MLKLSQLTAEQLFDRVAFHNSPGCRPCISGRACTCPTKGVNDAEMRGVANIWRSPSCYRDRRSDVATCVVIGSIICCRMFATEDVDR